MMFCYLLLDSHVKTAARFSPRDKRLFEIIEVEITRVDCIIKINKKKKKNGEYPSSRLRCVRRFSDSK